MMPNDAEKLATELLEWAAMPYVLERAKRAVAEGTHKWIFDPDVDGVVGLVETGARTQEAGEAQYTMNQFGVLHGNGPTARIIVYLESADFECDEDWIFS